MTYCRIILDGGDAHAVGTACTGKVVCDFDNDVQILGIKLELIKTEHTSWTSDITYSGEETVVISDKELIAEGRIGPGKYEEPFEFVLPNKCSQTCSTLHGYIQYELKAIVIMPSPPNYEHGVLLNVISPVDFNLLSDLPLRRAQYQDEKNLVCDCFMRGPLTLDVFLEKEAYVLGEPLKVRVHVNNTSLSGPIREVSVRLTSVITEKFDKPKPIKKYTTELVGSFCDGPVLPYAEKDFNMEIPIPLDLTLYNFSSCRLFSQQFILTAKAKVPTWEQDLMTESIIVLGHIPRQYMHIAGSQILFQYNPYSVYGNQGSPAYSPTASVGVASSTPLLTTRISEGIQRPGDLKTSTDANPPSYYDVTGNTYRNFND